MKYTLLIILLFLFTSCHSAAKYKSIKNSRSSQTSKNNHHTGGLASTIDSWLGVPYKYGGMSKRGIDCSGFTTIIYKDIYGLKLPRNARDQYLYGRKIRMNQVRSGDLVFFRGVRGSGIDHVGIYLGNGKFVHASTSNGVIISDLSKDYYNSRFVGACRYYNF